MMMIKRAMANTALYALVGIAAVSVGIMAGVCVHAWHHDAFREGVAVAIAGLTFWPAMSKLADWSVQP